MSDNRVERILDLQEKARKSVEKLREDPAKFFNETRAQIVESLKMMLMLVMATSSPLEPELIDDEEYVRKLPGRIAKELDRGKGWMDQVLDGLEGEHNKSACRKILQRLAKIIHEELGEET